MAPKSDFMAAEEIKAILDGRDKTEQERIIRWVSESVGIAPSQALQTSNVGQQTASLPASAPASQTTHPADPSSRRKDIKSFVNEKSPKSDVQFAAVAAYFYGFEASPEQRKEVIVPNDLQDAGRQARGFGFKNAQQTLANAVTLGYFDRAGRGEFKLNAVGENLVAMALPGTSPAAGNVAKPKRKKPKTAPKSKAKPKKA
jgi:hypothetical protein